MLTLLLIVPLCWSLFCVIFEPAQYRCIYVDVPLSLSLSLSRRKICELSLCNCALPRSREALLLNSPRCTLPELFFPKTLVFVFRNARVTNACLPLAAQSGCLLCFGSFFLTIYGLFCSCRAHVYFSSPPLLWFLGISGIAPC
jgi:hypothetical protein